MEDKKRKNNLVKKIGMVKINVRGEEIGQATQVLSASSVASMTIMQRSAYRLNVIVVVRLDTMQGIVNPKTRGKR